MGLDVFFFFFTHAVLLRFFCFLLEKLLHITGMYIDGNATINGQALSSHVIER